MSQSTPTPEGKALRWVTNLVLAFAILESSGFILVFSAVAPLLLVVLAPITFGLSLWLFRWLCFRGLSDTWALFCVALAVGSWPWTTFLLLCRFDLLGPGPRGVDLAWLFGPLIPYAVIGAGGLVYHRRKASTT